MPLDELWRHDEGSFTALASEEIEAARAVEVFADGSTVRARKTLDENSGAFVGFARDNDRAEGDTVRIQYAGIAHAIASAPISVGDPIATAASGKVQTATGEMPVVGLAISRAVANDQIVSVLVGPNSATSGVPEHLQVSGGITAALQRAAQAGTDTGLHLSDLDVGFEQAAEFVNPYTKNLFFEPDYSANGADLRFDPAGLSGVSFGGLSVDRLIKLTNGTGGELQLGSNAVDVNGLAGGNVQIGITGSSTGINGTVPFNAGRFVTSNLEDAGGPINLGSYVAAEGIGTPTERTQFAVARSSRLDLDALFSVTNYGSTVQGPTYHFDPNDYHVTTARASATISPVIATPGTFVEVVGTFTAAGSNQVDSNGTGRLTFIANPTAPAPHASIAGFFGSGRMVATACLSVEGVDAGHLVTVQLLKNGSTIFSEQEYKIAAGAVQSVSLTGNLNCDFGDYVSAWITCDTASTQIIRKLDLTFARHP